MSTSRTEPLYPDVTVKLTGRDGNIGSVMGLVRSALAQAGKDTNVMNQLWAEVMDAENYQLALQAVMKVVHVT